ncbi:MAG: GAF domain-containing sensor histidine kinase [Coriobacteriia bacterium]|nr:GAF domain-containing sensor histidine kinase [Coriobacteriia bacterium]
MGEGANRLAAAVRVAWPLRQRARRHNLVPSPPVDQLELITALNSVAESISSARTVHDVLSIIVEAAKRFTGTEKVIVCLVDEYAHGLVMDESTLVVRGARSAHVQEWWGEHLGEIAEEVFSDGRSFFDVDHERGAWLLAVPVRTNDEPLGVLVAINAINHRLQPEHSAFLSILGAFAAVSIVNARLAEEGRYAMLAGERERIAREMHDGISQSLFSISLGMELARKQLLKDPAVAMRTLDDLESQLAVSSAEIRRLIYDLRPMKLQELGLIGSVQTWVMEATRGSLIRGVTEVSGSVCNLTPAQEACLYRVAKEAVSNAVRHSGGNRVAVCIEFNDDSVMLTVADDGDGFATGQASPHLEGTGGGLRNMTERMIAEGGALSVESSPGAGTVVRARLPLEVV